jgi:iron complex transport system substrate-binding protein
MPELPLERPPQRVVSLVPSLTESLFELGLGASLVGVTRYCVHPAAQTALLPRVGGTKDASLEKILALQPDLVIASREENERSLIETLQGSGIAVWVTFPCTARQAIDDLWSLAGIFHSERAATALHMLETALEYAEMAAVDLPRQRYFCPIWQAEEGGQEWWMTFNQATYPHDLLRILGGENIFGARERRYPLAADLGQAEPEPVLERDVRYPRLTQAEIVAAAPEWILLPGEPFPYGEDHVKPLLERFGDTPAAKNGRVICLEGDLLTWAGTRLGRALAELGGLFQR